MWYRLRRKFLSKFPTKFTGAITCKESNEFCIQFCLIFEMIDIEKLRFHVHFFIKETSITIWNVNPLALTRVFDKYICYLFIKKLEEKRYIIQGELCHFVRFSQKISICIKRFAWKDINKQKSPDIFFPFFVKVKIKIEFLF